MRRGGGAYASSLAHAREVRNGSRDVEASSGLSKRARNNGGAIIIIKRNIRRRARQFRTDGLSTRMRDALGSTWSS